MPLLTCPMRMRTMADKSITGADAAILVLAGICFVTTGLSIYFHLQVRELTKAGTAKATITQTIQCQ